MREGVIANFLAPKKKKFSRVGKGQLKKRKRQSKKNRTAAFAGIAFLVAAAHILRI